MALATPPAAITGAPPAVPQGDSSNVVAFKRPVDVPDAIQSSLSAYIDQCYSQAKSAKQIVTERLLRCERQRRGEYDPEKLAEIRKTGGSEMYLMLTDIKCTAAESWIKDVMLTAGERPWDMTPTQEPDLPPEVHDAIAQGIVQEVVAVQQQSGQPVPPEAIEMRMQEVYDQLRHRLAQVANKASDRMGYRMQDILQEADWRKTFSEIIYDFVTFPACFLKGPILRRKKMMKWGANWTPTVLDIVALEFERVSAYDMFPSPMAENEQNGFLCERTRYSLGDISDMKGVPGYKDDEIDEVIDRYRRGGLRGFDYGDTQQDQLKGRNTWYDSHELIEGVEFWGDAPGALLEEWGMKSVDASKVYAVNCIKIGPFTIKSQLNPHPLGCRPYSRMCFEDIPGAFWGLALPEKMRDVASMCNAAGRALANNLALASGPQAEVNVDRIADGERITSMAPLKIWQTTSDRTGSGQPAIRFFQPDMNAGPLLQILQHFTRTADEVTGIPNYVYGSGTTGGAGRTAQGLSMLMENASKGIKQAIMSLDRGVGSMLMRLYYHLMLYDPDHSIKGDMQVVASGIVGALVRENIQEKRQAFLQATANPIDLQIVGLKGRAAVLRELAKGLYMDEEDIVPSEQEMEKKEEGGGLPPEVQQQMQEMQQMVGELQQKLADKSLDIQVRREEMKNRIDETRIKAKALVDSREHENEVRAHTEAEGRMREARLQARVDREKIRAQKDMKAIDARAKVASSRVSAEAGSGQVDAVAAAMKPVMAALDKLAKQIDSIPNDEPDIVNVNVGETTKNVGKPKKKAKP